MRERRKGGKKEREKERSRCTKKSRDVFKRETERKA